MTVMSVDELNYEIGQFKIRSVDLAKSAELSKSTVSKILNKKYDPTVSKLVRLSNALDTLLGIRRARVKDVMNRPVTVPEGATIEAAVLKMEKGKFSQLPVTRSGKLTGVITEMSIMRAFENNCKPSSPVGEALGVDWAVLGPLESVEKARSLLKEVQAVIVVQDQTPVGIVTRTEFIDWKTEPFLGSN